MNKIFELETENNIDDVWLDKEVEALLQERSKGKIKVTELDQDFFLHLDRDADITYTHYDKKKRLKIVVCRHCGQNVSVTKVPKRGTWLVNPKGTPSKYYQSPGLPGEEDEEEKKNSLIIFLQHLIKKIKEWV